MKPILKMQLAAVLTFTLGFSSCSKKDNTPKPDTKTLLTAKTWSVITIGYDDNRNQKIDAAEIHSMQSGQYLYTTYNPDGNGTQSFNGFNSAFTWKMEDSQTILANLSDVTYIHIKVLSVNQFDFETFDRDNKIITGTFKCVPK